MNSITIKSLYVRGVKGLREAKVEPGTTTFVVIRGENAAGKSSLVDSIKFGFAGKRSHDQKVIRIGEPDAEESIDCGAFVINQRWTRDDEGKEIAKLEVISQDGTRYPSPQKLLDGLFDELSFSAIDAFLGMKDKDQVDLLKKLIGVDTSLLEAQRLKVFTARTQTNRDLDAVRARLKALPAMAKPPPPVDTAALVKEQTRLRDLITAATNAAGAHAAQSNEVARRRNAVAEAEQALKRAQDALKATQTAWQDALAAEAQAENAREEAAEAAAGAPEEFAKLQAQLSEAGETATANGKWAERERLIVEEKQHDEKSKAETAAIEKLDADKAALFASARLPVKGLTFDDTDGNILVDGVPFEQVNQGMQIRVAVALLIARNPKLKVTTVRNAGLLSPKSLELLAELCEEHGIQCWVELPDPKGPATVYVVDGEVRKP